MSVAVQSASATSPSPSPVAEGPVLVACDGSLVHDALFQAARLAGQALGVPVQVIGVCEPTPGVAAGMELVPVPPELDDRRREAMLDDVRRTVSIASAGDPRWPVEVHLGSPSRTLADVARQRHAALLVMGIGRHNPLDRLFGTETTLATLRESSVPVLAVGAHFSAFPQHVVVGMDFSKASRRAAQIALRLMGGKGRLTLVHVRPRFEHPTDDWQAWDSEYGRTLPPLFDQLRQELDAPDTVLVETVTVRGDPAPALLAYAQQGHADLIALGTQRHGFLERLVVGSVATRVLRTARCAVLAVPASAVAGSNGRGP